MTRELHVLFNPALPRARPHPWLSTGLGGPGEQRWRAKPCLQAVAVEGLPTGTARTPGTGSTCQAPLRARLSVHAAPASSWPLNGTGRAKINTHLAGAAALRSLLREEAVLASAGSSLPRAGSGSRGRPRRSPCVGDRQGMARTVLVPAMERASHQSPLPSSALQAARGGRQLITSPSVAGNPRGRMAGNSSPVCICTMSSEDELQDTGQLSSSTALPMLVAMGCPAVLMLPRVWFSPALADSALGEGSQRGWLGLH